MKKKLKALIGDIGSMSLSEIRRALSELSPPYPARLLDALERDGRAGARQLLKGLESRQRADERRKRRVEHMLRHERWAYADGFRVVAGVDEVGRGPLAGPVVASAVVLPPSMQPVEINDSKLLTDAQRRKALNIIAGVADIGVGVVSVEEIDRTNIHKANLLAMELAIEDLPRAPDLVLVDGRPAAGLKIPQRAIVKGDKLSMSIAAASIVAKVVRDQMMLEFDKKYPQYGFAKHKGYATSEHLASIRKFGVSPIHRRSFAPVRECLLPSLL